MGVNMDKLVQSTIDGIEKNSTPDLMSVETCKEFYGRIIDELNVRMEALGEDE